MDLFGWVLILQGAQVWARVGCQGLGRHPAHPPHGATLPVPPFSRTKAWRSGTLFRAGCWVERVGVQTHLFFWSLQHWKCPLS